MVEEVAVVLNPESLSSGVDGPSFGEIYFLFDELSFPQRGWTDFAVVILSWWLDSLNQIVRGGSEGELQFMDGDYTVRLRRISDEWSAEFMDGASEMRATELISIEALTTAVVTAAKKVLADSPYARDRDMRSLRVSYDALVESLGTAAS